MNILPLVYFKGEIMTMFEQRIFDYVEMNNGTQNAEDIANGINVVEYPKTSAKDIIKDTINRMTKAGVAIEYNWKGYRVKATA